MPLHHRHSLPVLSSFLSHCLLFHPLPSLHSLWAIVTSADALASYLFSSYTMQPMPCNTIINLFRLSLSVSLSLSFSLSFNLVMYLISLLLHGVLSLSHSLSVSLSDSLS